MADKRRPTQRDIAKAFDLHHDHHRRLAFAEVERDSGSETELSKDYAGRVLFELFQNAVDKAHSLVVVTAGRRRGQLVLRVANDGSPVEVNADFDFDDEHADRKDFHALCSLHTSAKTAKHNVGNKGVGFRSVFTLGEHASVWSRLRSGGWWGLCLTRPGRKQRDTVAHRAGLDLLQRIRSTIQLGPDRRKADRKYASFYFPAPLYSSSQHIPMAWQAPSSAALDSNSSRLVTVVEILVDADNRDALQDYINAFARAPFHFVHLKYPEKIDLRILIEGVDGTIERRIVPEDGWTVHHWPRVRAHRKRQRALARLAREAEFDLPEPQIALGFPPESRIKDEPNGGDHSARIETGTDCAPLLIGYLPTEARAPLAVQVHADFLLGAARKGVSAGSGSPVERYNAALLTFAGEYLAAILSRTFGVEMGLPLQGIPSDKLLMARSDLFQLLTPAVKPGESQMQDRFIEAMAFGDGWKVECWSRWAKLAAAYFGTDRSPRLRPKRAYDGFWKATSEWIWKVVFQNYSGTPRRTTQANAVRNVLDALREERACVIPAIDSDEDQVDRVHSAEVLPPAFVPTLVRSERRIFIRRVHEESEVPYSRLPSLLREEHRLVTSFDLPPIVQSCKTDVTGLSEWRRWELLGELRQPVAPPAAADGRSRRKAIKQQGELLCFAHLLWSTGGHRETAPAADPKYTHFAWRGQDANEQNARVGRALATMYLPIQGGQWLPASQVVIPRDDNSAPWLGSHGAVWRDQIGVLDRTRLRRLLGERAVDEFSRFLGASPWLPLREAGRQGAAQALEFPPGLDSSEVSRGRVPDLAWFVLPSEIAADSEAPLAAAEALLDAMVERITPPSLIALEGINKRRSPVGMLASDRWYPIYPQPRETPSRLPCAYLQGGVEGLERPESLVLREGSGGLRTESLPGITPPADRRLLDHLERIGIVPISSSTSPRKLMTLLERLKERNGGKPPERGDPERQRFRELYGGLVERLVEAIPSDEEKSYSRGLPLLIAQSSATPTTRQTSESLPLLEREWIWLLHGDRSQRRWPAFCANARELATVEKVFPDQPVLVVSISRAKRFTDLGAIRRAALKTEVCPDAKGIRPIEPASSVVADLFYALAPSLLALGETVRTANRTVDPAVAAERWDRARFLRVKDTYLKHRLTVASSSWTETEHRGSYNDVFFVEHEKQEQLWVLFDTEDQRDDALAPLNHFGRALASVLLHDQWYASHFEPALVLAEFDRRKDPTRKVLPGPELKRHLDFKDASGLLSRMEQGFRPLSDDSRKLLRRAVTNSLKEMGLKWRPRDTEAIPRVLTPSNLKATRESAQGIDQTEVSRALQNACIEVGLDRLVPIVDFESHHRESWQSWLIRVDRQRRLEVWITAWCHERGVSDPDRYRRQLLEVLDDQDIITRQRRLRFDERLAAIAALEKTIGESTGLSAETLENDLPDIQFAEVKRIQTIAEAKWGVESFPPLSPSSFKGAPPDEKRSQERQRMLLGVGEDAERVILPLAVERTMESLRYAERLGDPDVAWSTLGGVLTGSVGARKIEVAREEWQQGEGRSETAQALRDALHVSHWWWAAGYDLLSLAHDESGRIYPVRWEVKSVQESGIRQIHLSENELAVARAVLLGTEEDPARRYEGTWCLIAVAKGERESDAVDVTDVVVPLLNPDPEHPLNQLREDGVRPDGLVLRLRKRADHSGRTP